MKFPNAGWAVFNLFRLTAVTFLILALVAQFIALARYIPTFSCATVTDDRLMMTSDLKAQSEAKHPPLSNSTATATAKASGKETSTRTLVSSVSSLISTVPSLRTNPLPPASVDPISTFTSQSAGRDAPLISVDRDENENKDDDENGDPVTVSRPTSPTTATRTPSTQAAQTDVLVVPAKRQVDRRADGDRIQQEPVNGAFGLSSIPTSPGGILYVACFIS